MIEVFRNFETSLDICVHYNEKQKYNEVDKANNVECDVIITSLLRHHLVKRFTATGKERR